jgi:periplasmic copper chaperone A
MQESKRLAPLDLTVRQSGTRRMISAAVIAATVAFALWCVPPNVYAQGTLPLPAPGTTPAPATPETPPGAPGAPGEDARARAAAMAAKANIDVTDAWARATAANATTAQVYLHLVSAKDADRLVGLEVSNATRIDVREAADQGAAKGNAAPSVDVPAGGTVNFAPGNRHLLLTGLKAPLREGESFLLTLRFDKGGTQTAVVKVLGANASGPAQAAAERRGDTTAGATER